MIRSNVARDPTVIFNGGLNRREPVQTWPCNVARKSPECGWASGSVEHIFCNIWAVCLKLALALELASLLSGENRLCNEPNLVFVHMVPLKTVVTTKDSSI